MIQLFHSCQTKTWSSCDIVALHLKLQAKGNFSDCISLPLARDMTLNVVTLVVAKSAGTYSFNLFWGGEDGFEFYFRLTLHVILFVCLYMP